MTRVEPLGRPGAGSALPGPVAIYGTFSTGQYYEDILAGVAAAAEAAGVGVIAVQASSGVLPSFHEVGSQETVSRTAWDHFDAAVVILQTLSLEYVERLRAAGKFLVAIAQRPRGTQAAVGLDNACGIRVAVAHLINHGHRRIGFLSPGWQVDTRERYAAYRAQMSDAGLPPLPLLGEDLSTEISMDEQGYVAARRFLAAGRDCTAVIAAPDLVALGFMRGVREAGVAVPDELAIVGVDDIAEAAVCTPPLASVAISFQRVGHLACELALRGAAGEPVEGAFLVPQRFVPRESCGCPSSSGSPGADRSGPPMDVFAHALAEAAQEGTATDPVEPARVEALARRAGALLLGGVGGGRSGDNGRSDRATIEALAAEVNTLCPLDRSVRAVLHAIRALVEALVTAPRDRDRAQAWDMNATALDLCDAIRSCQLQRRMAEYVALKRLQTSQYFIGDTLLGNDRTALRSLDWLWQTHAQAGVLGLWAPSGQSDRLGIAGVFERNGPTGAVPVREVLPVEAFPPVGLLRRTGDRGWLVVVTQVRFEDNDWGLLAVAGDGSMRSSLVQASFHQWAVLMSTSLAQERSNADLARQAAELKAAYQTQLALLEEVRVSEERYALATEAAQGAVWDWSVDTGNVYYSSRWKALIGHRDNEVGVGPDEWLGRIHPDDTALVREYLDRARAGADDFFDFEHRLRTSTGEYRWIACTGRSVLDPEGRVYRLVGSFTDVTARRLLQEQLEQEALFDALTGLAKATLFKDRLDEAIARARQYPDHRFAVLFIDLNGFKEVNDGLGHGVGDELLASIGRRLSESLRRGDVAARLGGDEFGVLINEVDHLSELPRIVRRAVALITAPHLIGNRTVTVGASVGVAISGAGYPTADAMLDEADAAMYHAKRRSRQHRPDAGAFVVVMGNGTASPLPTDRYGMTPMKHG